MMRKVDLQTSADFSFLISVPVITAATLYELLKSYKDFHSDEVTQLLIGLIVSFVVAIIAIKTFLIILKKLGLTPFAYYRIIFGILYFLYTFI
jgi:undecaprenyl-diphosphatase